MSMVPTPRVALVLAGASGALGRPGTALEQATMPQLGALAAGGRVGRLRTVAAHLPATEATAAAALLGTVPSMALDPGAVAAEAVGRMLATDERCTLVDVLDMAGEPAPALDVQRAVDAIRSQLPWHRIVAERRGFQVLLAGTGRPEMPHVAGLQLVPAEPGFLPPRPLTDDAVVIGVAGSTTLGVAALLGARIEPVDGARASPRDPVPARLRGAAIAALMTGAGTIVIEAQAPLHARRGVRDDAARQRAVCAALELIDRELIGPLASAASWIGACLSVTGDLARGAAGEPLRDEVPIVMSGPRAVLTPETSPLLAPLGTALPPRYCERGVVSLPIVTSPFSIIPTRAAGAPRRFVRDPVSGRTQADELAMI